MELSRSAAIGLWSARSKPIREASYQASRSDDRSVSLCPASSAMARSQTR